VGNRGAVLPNADVSLGRRSGNIRHIERSFCAPCRHFRHVGRYEPPADFPIILQATAAVATDPRHINRLFQPMRQLLVPSGAQRLYEGAAGVG
jgi:hypothetical protein